MTDSLTNNINNVNSDIESCKINDIEDINDVGTTLDKRQVNLVVETTSLNISNREEELLSLIALVFLIILLLGIIGAIISFYVFGIKFLVEDKDESEECSSEIWDYVLTTIVVSLVFLLFAYTDRDKDSGSINPFLSLASSLTSIGLGIWGFILCQTEDCSTIKNSNLYTFATVASYSQVISGGITFLIFLTIVFLACRDSYKK